MTQFVIDIDDGQEKWDELYAKLAELGETGSGLALTPGTPPGMEDLPHPYLWYLAIAHGPR